MPLTRPRHTQRPGPAPRHLALAAGHKLLTLLLAHTLDSEACEAQEVRLEPEQDVSAMVGGRLPPLLKMTPEQEETFVTGAALTELDFSNGNADKHTHHQGWLLTADSKEKYGLIATKPYVHMALPLVVRYPPFLIRQARFAAPSLLPNMAGAVGRQCVSQLPLVLRQRVGLHGTSARHARLPNTT